MERPPCPDGHRGSRVLRDGWFGKPGQRRQRWRCVRGAGDDQVFHKFFEPLPRLVRHGDEEGHACPECATQLEPWEGQPAPRLYGFTARDVALTLTWVAGGSTYRDASARIRTRAGRELETRVPPRK